MYFTKYKIWCFLGYLFPYKYNNYYRLKVQAFFVDILDNIIFVLTMFTLTKC